MGEGHGGHGGPIWGMGHLNLRYSPYGSENPVMDKRKIILKLLNTPLCSTFVKDKFRAFMNGLDLVEFATNGFAVSDAQFNVFYSSLFTEVERMVSSSVADISASYILGVLSIADDVSLVTQLAASSIASPAPSQSWADQVEATTADQEKLVETPSPKDLPTNS